MKILLILCLLLLAFVAVTDGKKKGKKGKKGRSTAIDMTYTVENTAVEPHFTNVFVGTVRVNGRKPVLLDVMDKIAEVHSSFSYTSETHNTLGEFITGINGQMQVPASNLYWLVMREYDDDGTMKRCYLPVGASTYKPKSGEKIVWKLMEWDNDIPTCDGGNHE